MTIFGILWIMLIFITFCMKDIKYILTLTLIGMLFQCSNVISINQGITCGAQLVTSFAFIIKSSIYKYNKKVNSGIDVGFVFICIYILINSLFINVASFDFLNILQLVVYVFTFYRIKKVSYFISKNYLDKCIRIITYIVLGFGFLNIFINLFGVPKNNLLQLLFYNEKNNPNIYYFKNSTRFYSTFMEPSYVAGLLVGLFSYFYLKDKSELKKNDKLLVILLGIAILLTFSSTAYGTLAIVLIIIWLKNINKSKTWGWIFLSIIAFVVVFMFTDILDKVIFNKSSSSSGIVREILNNRAYSSFQSNPLFGNGYKSMRASSLAIDILGELGIVGLVIYLIPIINYIKYVFIKKNLKNYCANIFVLAIVISQFIACPDLDLCSFWLVMYIYALYSSDKIKEENGEFNEKSGNINIS